MHTRPLLAHTQSTRNRKRQPNALNKQRREPQKPLHHKPRNDALHLTDPTARRIRRKALDQPRSREAEHARERNVHQVTERPEPAAPALPLGTPGLGAPAAEALVEVEGRGAVAQLDVGQPLGDDVEERSVEADGAADEGHDDPGLAGVVCFCYFAPPDALAAPEICSAIGVAGAEGAFVAAGFAAELFARGVLDPVDCCEIFVALYFCDLLDDDVVGVRGICGFGVGIVGVFEGVNRGVASAERGCEGG